MVDLTYAPHVEAEPIPGRAIPRFAEEASPGQFGGQVGQALEGAGQVANSVYQKNEAAALAAQKKAQGEAQQSMLTDAHNQLQALSLKLTHDPTNGAFIRQGKDAFDLQSKYLPQWEEGSKSIIDGVADPLVRQHVMEAAGTMGNQLNEQLDSHEIQQHKQFNAQTAQASVKISEQAAAANYNHPDIVASNRANLDASIENLGKQSGWSADQIAEAKLDSFSRMHTNVIDAMLTDDKWGMAKQYLGAHKTEMDPHSAFAAERTIEAHMKEKQNEAKQDIMDRFQDSMTAARYGLSNPVAVTKAELAIAYPHDYQRKWDGIKSMQAAGAQAKAYNTMSPEEIKADLEKSRPTQGGPESAFAIESYEIRARAAQQSAEARQADPAKFAIDSGLGWKPLDMSKPADAMAQLTSRANTLDQVSHIAGTNAPLLTKSETKALTQTLDQQPPTTRLQTLQALRAALPDEQHYQSVMKSIAPESPLTSIAAATLDRPPKAQQPSWYSDTYASGSLLGQRILEGQDLLRAKDEKGIKSNFPMPPDRTTKSAPGLDTAWATATGGAGSDLFRDRPYLSNDMFASYKAAYAAEAAHMGLTTGALNEDLAEKVAKQVIGNLATYGHSTVAVPRGMDPTRFTSYVDAASAQAMKRVGYTDEDVAALRGYGIRELGTQQGSGRYVIINGNGDPLKSRQGQPVIIDLNEQYRGADQPKAAPPRPGFFSSLFHGDAGPAVTGDGSVQ